MNGAAVILCGGRSRRMGQPKAWLPFGPESMLQRVVRLVCECTQSVVVVAGPIEDQPLPELPPRVVIARDPVLGLGPMQGIVTGLSALPESVDLVYMTAVDAPFLNPAWVRRLAELIAEDDIAIPLVGGLHQPLAAIYRRRSVLPAARSQVQAGRLRVTSLIEMLPTRVVSEAELTPIDPGFETLRNLNTPEDYRAALTDAGFGLST